MVLDFFLSRPVVSCTVHVSLVPCKLPLNSIPYCLHHESASLSIVFCHCPLPYAVVKLMLRIPQKPQCHITFITHLHYSLYSYIN